MTQKQVKYAETIHSSGTDLLALINDILDLSKIESGKMDVEVGSIRFAELRDLCLRTFRHVADGKNLDFSIDMGESLPADSIITDSKRLQQVLKNLLSNALKFTEQGARPPAHGRAPPRAGDPEITLVLNPGEIGGGILGHRYRYRDSAGQAAHRLRSLPASGWNYQPQVRRHGTGTLDQP